MNTEMILAIALGVPALAVLYALECWLWPNEHCPRCAGSGRRPAPTGGKFGPCRYCGGDGRRLRFGRRLWDTWQGWRQL